MIDSNIHNNDDTHNHNSNNNSSDNINNNDNDIITYIEAAFMAQAVLTRVTIRGGLPAREEP